MSREELLLISFAEECNEVAQRISKALRFGLDEKQKGQDLTNRQRIRAEFNDLIGLHDLLMINRTLPPIVKDDFDMVELKFKKVEKYLEYSKELGILKE